MTEPALQEILTSYLALRRTLGYTTPSIERTLQSFVRHLDQHSNGKPVRAKLAIDWACDDSSRSVARQCVRLSLARGFLNFLKASRPETEIPDNNLIASPRRTTPYVFSEHDLQKVMERAGQAKGRTTLEPRTLQTLLGLMACTGLRPGEAIRLEISDVQLEHVPPRLLIRDTKFNKSRWVPLHDTAAGRLREYLKWRRALKGLSKSFFVSTRVELIRYQVLRRAFMTAVTAVGIYSRPRQLQPTLHSLRHTFAVRRVKNWYHEGADVRGLLPNLCVYLGHSNPASSYWYLTAVPELMGSAAQLFENYAMKEDAQ